VFACAIGHLAEALNHHPDLLVGYGKVRVVLVTHDAGGGLTEYDFELARRIEKLAG
jgi:4a-hydroxytetrahydrobiopterin dehydratase